MKLRPMTPQEAGRKGGRVSGKLHVGTKTRTWILSDECIRQMETAEPKVWIPKWLIRP